MNDVPCMSQTCDIEHGKIDSLLLCPRWDLWVFVDRGTAEHQNWGTETRDALRRGNMPGYHLLNEANQDDINIGLSVIDFHQVYTAPLELVRQFVASKESRLRLLPPYREHLAQAFARFFMRVGLPIDMAREKIASPPRASSS